MAVRKPAKAQIDQSYDLLDLAPDARLQVRVTWLADVTTDEVMTFVGALVARFCRLLTGKHSYETPLQVKVKVERTFSLAHREPDAAIRVALVWVGPVSIEDGSDAIGALVDSVAALLEKRLAATVGVQQRLPDPGSDDSDEDGLGADAQSLDEDDLLDSGAPPTAPPVLSPTSWRPRR